MSGLTAAHSELFHKHINGKLFAALEEARIHPPFNTLLQVNGRNGGSATAWNIELQMTEVPEGSETATEISLAETPVLVGITHPFSDDSVSEELDKLIKLAVQVHSTQKKFADLYL